jgi:hypothetical protein
VLRTTNIQLFSYKEIKRATDNFDHVNKLGRGGFGTVYKVLLPPFVEFNLSSSSEECNKRDEFS